MKAIIKNKIRKCCMVIILVVVTSLNADAQDTIVMKNQSFVLAKVTEVLPDEVKYVKTINTDGPIYSNKLYEISKIKYQNGMVENYNMQEPIMLASKTQNKLDYLTPRQPILDITMFSENELFGYMMSKNNSDINKYINKSKVSRGFQNIGFLAIPFAILSVWNISSATFNGEKSQHYQSELNKGGVFAGLTALSVSGSIYFKIDRTAHKRKAIKLFNELYTTEY